MSAHETVEMSEHGRHHLSLLTAKTRVNGADELGPTVGIDYEYRINPLIGVGAVLERAFGSVDATSFFAVADIHLWRGLAIQTGPGFERVDGETKFAGRFGLLYELEFKSGLTISPQLHLDVAGENSVVYGLAVGRSF